MTKKYEVIWASVANADLVEIIQYIHTDNPLAAADNLNKIKNKVSDLVLRLLYIDGFSDPGST